MADPIHTLISTTVAEIVAEEIDQLVIKAIMLVGTAKTENAEVATAMARGGIEVFTVAICALSKAADLDPEEEFTKALDFLKEQGLITPKQKEA